MLKIETNDNVGILGIGAYLTQAFIKILASS